jgi:uncharacterized protein (DUF2141 family)
MTSKRFFQSVACCLTISTLASGFCLNAAAQQPEADGATLVIEGVGFADAVGNAMICLLNTEEAFKSADVRKDREEVKHFFKAIQDVRIQFIGNVATATCKIDNLKPGQYSAYIIHDRNQNGKMDSNLVGFPLEAFGFSNDIRPRVLPVPKHPSWKDTGFVVKPGENRIRIHIVN